MVESNEQLKCGWCNELSTAEEWQNSTLNQCFTREQRRAFRKITQEKYFKQDQKMYYRCPKCGVWQRACNITLTRIIDGKENKLGGKPVFRVVNNKAE